MRKRSRSVPISEKYREMIMQSAQQNQGETGRHRTGESVAINAYQKSYPFHAEPSNDWLIQSLRAALSADAFDEQLEFGSRGGSAMRAGAVDPAPRFLSRTWQVCAEKEDIKWDHGAREFVSRKRAQFGRKLNAFAVTWSRECLRLCGLLGVCVGIFVVGVDLRLPPIFSGSIANASTVLDHSPAVPPVISLQPAMVSITDQQKLRALVGTIEPSAEPPSGSQHQIQNRQKWAAFSNTAKHVLDASPASVGVSQIAVSPEVASPHLDRQSNPSRIASTRSASKAAKPDRRVTIPSRTKPKTPQRKIASSSTSDTSRRMRLGASGKNQRPSKERAPETLLEALDSLLSGR